MASPFLSSVIFSSDNNFQKAVEQHGYVPSAKAPQPSPNKLQIACGGKSAKEHVFGEQGYKLLEFKVYIQGLLRKKEDCLI